ncbi:hypothetical protein ACH3XW_43670 [Acanthocheilonema viteae]
MKSVSQSASKAVISYIHKLIQTNKFSHLIALIYDSILENSSKPFLNKAQVEIVLSLLCLPNQQVPNIVNYTDLCLLLKDAYDEKFGKMSNKNEESFSKSDDSWDEENLEEMEVLATLNSFRNKTHAQCPDIFNFIRQENLIRTVMRQAWRLQRLKRDLHEIEQRMNYLVAHFIGEKYCAFRNGEYSECDSGCHTDRSSSSNNSITKLFTTRRDEINELQATGQNFLTMDDNQRYIGINSYQKVAKSLNELKKLSSNGNIYINKRSTSSTSVRDVQKSNDFPLSINQIFDNMMVEDGKKSRIKLNLKKSMDVSFTVNHNSSNVKLRTNNSLSNDTNQISQHDGISMRMTQSVIGTNLLPNFKNKFVKLQLKTNFECHDCNEQIACKKIEMKKYIEFDISAFWNKK